MTDGEEAIRLGIAWLRAYGALMRTMPSLWPLCWQLLVACEAEACRLERALAAPGGAEVIDLAQHRRRRAVLLG